LLGRFVSGAALPEALDVAAAKARATSLLPDWLLGFASSAFACFMFAAFSASFAGFTGYSLAAFVIPAAAAREFPALLLPVLPALPDATLPAVLAAEKLPAL
jgi:hypothetical protein